MPKLRPAHPSDAEAIAEIYAPIVAETATSFEVEVPDTEEMRRRIERLLPDYPYLVAEGDEGLLGYAYAGPHRSRSAYRFSCDVTVYVARDAQGTGVGKALYQSLLKDLRERGLHRAYAGIALPNPASIALHEACGFRHIGTYHEVGFKLGQWHDVGWWECDLTQIGGRITG